MFVYARVCEPMLDCVCVCACLCGFGACVYALWYSEQNCSPAVL